MSYRKIGIATVLIAVCGLAMAGVRADQGSSASDSGAASDAGCRAEQAEVDKARQKAEILEYYKQIAFDPVQSGLLAISALAEIEAEPEERAEVFEQVLGETKELGLRNALRMVLDEIYTSVGAVDEAVENLRAMLAENDAVLATDSEPAEQ